MKSDLVLVVTTTFFLTKGRLIFFLKKQRAAKIPATLINTTLNKAKIQYNFIKSKFIFPLSN